MMRQSLVVIDHLHYFKPHESIKHFSSLSSTTDFNIGFRQTDPTHSHSQRDAVAQLAYLRNRPERELSSMFSAERIKNEMSRAIYATRTRTRTRTFKMIKAIGWEQRDGFHLAGVCLAGYYLTKDNEVLIHAMSVL
jgi:hypothetical protein